MGKNGQYVFNRRIGGYRVLGGIFGGENTLSLTGIGSFLCVPCRKLVTVLIRNIDFSYNDSLCNEMLN